MSDKQTYPNAGPNCDLSRYRTGEAPMVGDKVRLHGDCINGVRDEWPTCKLTIQRVYRSGEVEFPVPHRSIEKRALYAARFDLISRAHSPDAGKMVDPAHEPTLLEAADTCFLLEDDEPSQHGKPIACTQCWNALSEMQRESASRAALLSVAANEYQALVDWIFKAGSPMPPENTTAHRIASLIRELQAKLRAKGGG